MDREVPLDGERLIEERQRLHLTVLQAAVGAGISPQTLTRAESGKPVFPKTRQALARFYKVKEADLIADKAAS